MTDQLLQDIVFQISNASTSSSLEMSRLSDQVDIGLSMLGLLIGLMLVGVGLFCVSVFGGWIK